MFGISGVGKTSACRDYTSRHPGVLFVSASTLLKAAKHASGEALRTAPAPEIVDNQTLLSAALDAFRRGREHLPVLIDAHGIIDNDRELVRIPVEAIRGLKPDRLILLESPAESIVARRKNDFRARPKRNMNEIAVELAAERAAVTDYAAALKLPLYTAQVLPGFRLGEIL